MNIFDSNQKLDLRKIIFIGWYYCPVLYLAYSIFIISLGLVSPIIVQIQTHIIDSSIKITGNTLFSVAGCSSRLCCFFYRLYQ